MAVELKFSKLLMPQSATGQDSQPVSVTSKPQNIFHWNTSQCNPPIPLSVFHLASFQNSVCNSYLPSHLIHIFH